MSLYLTVFDGEREVTGWVFGHYTDFGCFRDKIAGVADASKYPTLMLHSDSDGEWSVAQTRELKRELGTIATLFRRWPAEQISGGFEHTAEYRAGARTLYECFHNVEGTNLFDALINLCDEAERRELPILFQ